MANIYGLFTEGFCWYVGSTNNVERRYNQHFYKTNPHLATAMIPSFYEWSMNVLEQCTEEQRFAKEREWYDRLKPILNLRVPGRSKREYEREYQSRPEVKAKIKASLNKEKELARQRAYRAANREKVNQKQREYRASRALPTHFGPLQTPESSSP